ncbi:MAG TPA: thiamine pyrophosphate-dependent enzyme [Gemmatimonadaceae bacterium]|nr:thiamine pyrophosphate-dependent enzyme [Gemmatimonadaceae bacterium]
MIDLVDALSLVRRHRRADDVVITTMAASRVWMEGGTQPLDFTFVPSCMGHATSLGLGLALAQPERRIFVCNGDGSMLMNLGSLISITAKAPPNLVVLVLDNGVYEVTGAQPTPGSPDGRSLGNAVDFAALARAAGFGAVYTFSERATWTVGGGEALGAPGPVFIWLAIRAEPERPGPRSPGPAAQRAQAFREALIR